MADVSTPQFAATLGLNASPGIAKLIGLRLTAFGGDAIVELNSGPQHYNPMGAVHGGVLCDIAYQIRWAVRTADVPPREWF